MFLVLFLARFCLRYRLSWITGLSHCLTMMCIVCFIVIPNESALEIVHEFVPKLDMLYDNICLLEERKKKRKKICIKRWFFIFTELNKTLDCNNYLQLKKKRCKHGWIKKVKSKCCLPFVQFHKPARFDWVSFYKKKLFKHFMASLVIQNTRIGIWLFFSLSLNWLVATITIFTI